MLTYKLKLIIAGEFPGSPDVEEYEINEDMYDFIRAYLGV